MYLFDPLVLLMIFLCANLIFILNVDYNIKQSTFCCKMLGIFCQEPKYYKDKPYYVYRIETYSKMII